MTNSDWYAEVEGKSADLPSSSDLFDGELFGDELIDIYNAAVGDGAHSESHENEIPTLPDQEVTAGAESKDKEIHPGAQVAATAAAIDDGLGAFRPATSFNDLTTLEPSPSKAKSGSEQTAAEASTASVNQDKDSGEKKRMAPAPVSAGPSTTKKGTAVGVKRKTTANSTSSKAQKSSSASASKSSSLTAVAVAKAKLAANAMKAAKAGTPNPLNGKSVPAPPTLSASSNKISSAKSKAANKGTKPDATPSAPGAASTAPKPAATEADFKGVAQAAISNLIQSTKTGEMPTAKSSGKKIDTSTKHIKALTGNNWVSACSGVGAAAVAATNVGSSTASISSADSQANANKPKRQNLTADQRAHQNRERNREHARNTRLRKKAYVEELKATLAELVAQRDKAELEKRQAEQREVEQREVRFRVIEEFLKLKGRNETNFSRWAAILEDGFTLTLPATDFQEALHGEPESGHGESVKLEQVLSSVTEVMAESNNFASFLQKLGKGEQKSNETVAVGFTYHCNRSNFFMDDSNAVLDWTANSEGAVKKGADSELFMRGSIRARFCPASNKLLSANIVFDTGAVHSQLPELTDIQSDAAAQAASHQADAILDSLQMPHLDKSGVTIVPQSGDSSDEGV